MLMPLRANEAVLREGFLHMQTLPKQLLKKLLKSGREGDLFDAAENVLIKQ